MTTHREGLRAGSFPQTAWTVLIAARDPASVEAKEAREEICVAYWKPLHSYLLSLGLTHVDAEDVTQKILADFCTDDWLARIDQAHGRMRHFFKAAARHAVANHFRHQRAAKRGGTDQTASLDDTAPGDLPQSPPTADMTFDRHWARTVMERTLTLLEQSYAQRGKQALFHALRPTLISAEVVQPYAEISSQLGVGEAQIRIEVHRLRRRLAQRLRDEVAMTLPTNATLAELEAESRYLVQSLAYASDA